LIVLIETATNSFFENCNLNSPKNCSLAAKATVKTKAMTIAKLEEKVLKDF